MKRTSWISWRIYMFALPVNMVVLVFAADHELLGFADAAIWALVGAISHAAIAPFVSLAIAFSNRFNNWRTDLLALIGLGIVRGIAINLCVDTFHLVQTVADGYKVFNSAVALPQWFIGLAIFIESRRAYQREFQSLFAKAMRKEQETQERHSLLPKGESSAEELIARLQFITSNLANDIQTLLKRPDALKDYSLEASRIEKLIDDDLRPASAQLWSTNIVSTPKISFWALVQISLFAQRPRAILVILASIPYLFVGLNGTFGLEVALSQCLIVATADLLIFGFAELVFYLKLLNRFKTNLILLIVTVISPLLLQLNLPEQYRFTDNLVGILMYQGFLSVTYIALLLAFNSYKVINEQRSEVIASLQKHLSSDKYSASLAAGGASIRNSDIAQYLHGEIQAGLTASSLLLQQAAKSGDSDLANEALERAAGLLNQDHTNISYTRMAKPEVKLQKIIAGWKGIADVTISLPSSAQLDETVLRNAVALIEEAIANSIRHAHATQIQVSGILKDDFLTINILSNGDSMAKGKAGLGTKLFNDLASEWNYASESGHNRLTFVLVNKL
jgi:signal transduction histidine kinase